MSEGVIWQRGPQGQMPNGQSINGQPGAYGTFGAGDHVTVYGEGWHRSWDNDPYGGDHSTNQGTGQITQH